MLVLAIVGLVFEPRCGRVIFGTLYFTSGIIASLLVAFIFPWLRVPVIGSSGAISGTLGACLVGAPKARIPLFLVLFVWLMPLLVLMCMDIWMLSFGLSLLLFLFMIFVRISLSRLLEMVPISYLIGGWVV